MTKASASHSIPESLAPGEELRLTFPELPDTLISRHTGVTEPPRLIARLPDDYSLERDFPLFVFLCGGNGERGGQVQLSVTGTTSYIAINMPLFKHHIDREEIHTGLLLSMDDFTILQHAFRTMLEALMQRIPNVRMQGSILGGFSNGAHATGILLAGQDAFTLDHFDHFLLYEGGMGPLLANILQKTTFRSRRILALYGDKPDDNGETRTWVYLGKALAKLATRHQIDLCTVCMRGYGHEQPDTYTKWILPWARGEDISEITTASSHTVGKKENANDAVH